ncbi:hypothetical protein Sjap_015653 [Stephania japonica]|uniref:Glutathione S-transferase n=1 Tax=Stephania japonica TaxID=461633 RepID=A0AAP0IJI4_9MAGN
MKQTLDGRRGLAILRREKKMLRDAQRRSKAVEGKARRNAQRKRRSRCRRSVGIAKAQGPEAKAESLEQAKAGLELIEKAFKERSKGGEFFNGDQIGYLDIAFGCYVGWIRVTESMHGFKLFDEEKTPGLVG